MINSFTTGWSILQENCIRGEIIFCLVKLATFTWFPEIVYLQDFLSDFHIVGREVVEGRQLKLGFASVTLLCCVMPAPDHQFLTISRKHFVLNSMSSSHITPMGTDFMTCLCCRWSTCGPRPPSSHQSRATHQPARMALLTAQWRPITWAPFFGMGDQRHYHHGDGAMGGEVSTKKQELYQYRGGGGDSLGLQYTHCPTEQRFQVKSIRLL